MIGVVTKKTVFECPVLLYRLGGLPLIVRVLWAKPGTTFLSVFTSVMNKGN